MKRLLLALSVLILIAVASPSGAQAGGYGPAGCGLGSIIFGNKPGIMQIFAATTNGIFANQTFGITFGTSNCQLSGPGGEAVAAFVETNRSVLAKDMARGSGETIATLTTLAGCSDQIAVGRTLQQKFRTVFSSPGVSDGDVSQSVVGLLRSTKELSCKKLI